MQKVALFLITSTSSHYNQSFKVARFLKTQGNKIVYGGDVDLKPLVLRNNFDFQFCPMSTIQSVLSVSHWSVSSLAVCFLKSLLDRLSNNRRDTYYESIFLIEKIIQQINPSLILMDSFMAPLSVIFNQTKARVVCLQTMMSTNKQPCVPPLTSSIISGNSFSCRIKASLSWNYYFLVRYFEMVLIRIIYFGQDNNSLLIDWMKNNLEEMIRFESNRTFHFTRKEIPEIILSPIELNYPWVGRINNQFYAGACINTDRQIDEEGKEVFFLLEKIANEKGSGGKLIYCSLGTLTDEHNKNSLSFYNKLVCLFGQRNELQLILSIGMGCVKYKCLLKDIPPNVHIFKFVPQLHVLSKVDLFITHGGLNSIVEAISYEVPMLIFPLNDDWDQNGNAARVVFHGLGIRLPFNSPTYRISKAIEYLLNDTPTRERLSFFGKMVRVSNQNTGELNAIFST